MASSGTGVGTPIVPPSPPAPSSLVMPEWCIGALPLATYAVQYARYENAFWGVAKEGEPGSAIWTLFERQELARALCEAQDEIEGVTEYFLEPKWLEEEEHPCSPKGVYLLERNHLIAGGVRATSIIEEDASVSHVTDPAIVAVSTTVTDPAEIKVYYPDTTQEITPLKIDLAGGTATIYIPRCRLVGIDYVDNPEYGLEYANTALFQDTVDVIRVYNDTSDVGHFVRRQAGKCTETTVDLCMTIKDKEISHIVAYQNSTPSGLCRSVAVEQAKFNYVSGLSYISNIAELALVRLAHSKMPGEPCGYDPIKEMWRRDNNTPPVLTVERLECQFGLSDGAWMAWKFAGQVSVDRMSVFG